MGKEDSEGAGMERRKLSGENGGGATSPGGSLSCKGTDEQCIW